ncbi:phosphoglycerate kinase [candidate division WOR-3 bacterium]|nr:phosphoglycerate kinase [candidate division WOR-3 bacterium]
MMNLRVLKDIDVKNKTVILRTDYNVPVVDGKISSIFRIEASVKTIKYLLNNNAKIIILSHRGRPNGERKQEYSLDIINDELSKLLDEEIYFFNDINEFGIKEKISKLPFPSVILFENIRFYPGEKNGNSELAEKIRELGDVYINDGFSVCHRKHMSVYTLPKLFKNRCAGYLLQNEVENLYKLTCKPESPYVFIVGGSKVSTKLDVLKNTIKYADTILIGGGLAFTFLKSFGFEIGKSLFEPDMVKECDNIFKEAKEKDVNIILPIDVISAKSIDDNESRIVSRGEMEKDDIGLDIGPMTAEIFKGAIMSAKTIVWNGPMGMFEKKQFAKGTIQIAKFIKEATKKNAFSVVGGGDSVAALNQLGQNDSVSFVSTGGGAMLEMLSGIELPGINVLKEES